MDLCNYMNNRQDSHLLKTFRLITQFQVSGEKSFLGDKEETRCEYCKYKWTNSEE